MQSRGHGFVRLGRIEIVDSAWIQMRAHEPEKLDG